MDAITGVLEQFNCENCDKQLDRGDVAWGSANTEAGTPLTWIEIQCQRCDNEIDRFPDWYPWEFGEGEEPIAEAIKERSKNWI